MSSIAIFPCRHTPAENVVKNLAAKLKLAIYSDENLIADTAAASGVSEDKLRSALFGKTSVFNKFTLEREKQINWLRQTLSQKIAASDVYLFNGFLTSLIPPKVSHVLKVLIVDSNLDRVAYATANGMDERAAQKSRKEFDKMAYGWTDFLFGKEAYDSSLFDLVLPVEQKSESALTEAVVKSFHTTSVLRTSESQKAADETVLEAKIEAILLENGHKVDIIVDGETATLTVKEDVLNFSKLEDELTQLALQVDGINKVIFKDVPGSSRSIYRKQKFELPSKVLFVDDEKEFVNTVSERLIGRDVGTYGVYDGESALLVVDEDKPDVMVLDLKMPGLHGVEVLRRTKERAPDVEVIILTGHGTMDDMQECMKLGAFAYLNKPVDIEELSATIKAANEKAAENSKK